MIYKTVLLALCVLLVANGWSQTYNVTSFGALGDGKSDNTAAIQKAIDECSKTGGEVYFPGGVFVSGTLMMKSNVTLHLSNKCVLQGSTDLKSYPYVDPGIDFYGRDWARQSLIFAKDVENVTIKGEGIIDGQGASFPITTNVKPDRYKNRPYLMWFVKCKNVNVEGISLRNSAFWMQHYLGCEDVRIDGIKIWNHSNKNNDMLDIDGCRNVKISNITGDSDDDGLTLKSTSPLISENITITNSVFSSHCNGIKMGTESTGGFRNVTITNCVVKPSAQTTTIYGVPKGMCGIALEIVDGGIMENITIDNIVIDGPRVPLFVRLGNRARPHTASAQKPGVGIVKNINIANIVATGADATGCIFTGIPGHPITNLSLSNISIETAGGGKADSMFRVIEELETDYPEATMFGKLPAYGFFIRHAKDVRLSNISFRSVAKEERPGIVFTDVNNFSLLGADIQSSADTKAVLFTNMVRNGLVSNLMHNFPAQRLIWKKASANISVLNVNAPLIKDLIKIN